MANRSNGDDYSAVHVPSAADKGNWQKEMLVALQNTAAPEPIRLACMRPQPNKPALFGEEFHGNISRDEAEEVLRGPGGLVNGRYLVRVGRTAGYTLSLSYGDKIEHYKFDCVNDKYCISSDTEEKNFETLTELVTDILSMLRVVSHMDGPSPEKKDRSNSRASKPHNFKEHWYRIPTWCDLCGKFMWGLKAQGMKCDECRTNVHHDCVSRVRGECKTRQKVTPTEKDKPRKKSSSSATSPKLPPDFFQHHCDYQEECSHFLTNLNVSAGHFAPDALNPCYCSSCCRDVDTPLCKSGEPARNYSLPIGWCRFKLSTNGETDHVKSNWNMAFVSLNPHEVEEVLENWLNMTQSEATAQEGPKPLTKLTPSIVCADLDAERLKYTNPENGDTRAGQVLLQAYIHPFSYRVMGRPGAGEEIDPYFKNDGIYWVTNQASSIVPFALLVKTMDATYLEFWGQEFTEHKTPGFVRLLNPCRVLFNFCTAVQHDKHAIHYIIVRVRKDIWSHFRKPYMLYSKINLSIPEI